MEASAVFTTLCELLCQPPVPEPLLMSCLLSCLDIQQVICIAVGGSNQGFDPPMCSFAGSFFQSQHLPLLLSLPSNSLPPSLTLPIQVVPFPSRDMNKTSILGDVVWGEQFQRMLVTSLVSHH